jgi:hypothetical protein
MRCLSCRTATLGIFLERVAGLSISQAISTRACTTHPLSATSRAHLHVSSTLNRRWIHFHHGRLARNAEASSPSQRKPDSRKPSNRSFHTQSKPTAESPPDDVNNPKSQARVEADSPNHKGQKEESVSERKPGTTKDESKSTAHGKQRNSKRETWQIQKEALEKKFGEEGWNPRKRLSPDTIEGIRAMHRQYPDNFTTPVLARHFRVSPEVIRRILRSKWTPSPEEMEKRRERWDRRGERIWTKLAEVGVRPPKKWREMGVGRAKPGEPPKWKRKQYWKAKHPENIYTKVKDPQDFIASRPDGVSNAQRESFADRIL